MNLSWLPQAIIVLTGALSIWMVNQKAFLPRKWASVVGLIGQPFWFYMTYTNEQWGIFALSVLYTISWAQGFYNYWIKKHEVSRGTFSC